MSPCINLEALPRTIELVRNACGGYEFMYIDQRRLPGELIFERTGEWRCVVDAIKTLAVRGAPAIGVAGAAAVALWAAQEAEREQAGGVVDHAKRRAAFNAAAEEIANARPTAVNLSRAVTKMAEVVHLMMDARCDASRIADALFDYVKAMEAADEDTNRLIGEAGAPLLPEGARVLTHCNAGSLATVFYGTALGVVYTAAAQGKIARVFADETRPVGQGARLTAWELAQVGVPITLICDNMAASLMAHGEVDAVIVGADRIAANGDTANKIGTYGVAVLAAHHGIPFYVAAPSSTVDETLASGAEIPIEERAADEVLSQSIVGVDVWNPAFDVTPAPLITRVVTECGAFKPSELLSGLSRAMPGRYTETC